MLQSRYFFPDPTSSLRIFLQVYFTRSARDHSTRSCERVARKNRNLSLESRASTGQPCRNLQYLTVAHSTRLWWRLDKCARLRTVFFSFFSFFQRRRSSLYPVSHMAPATPSVGISVSVCGRSGQCFRSYPRNYTSVWLSARTPCPSGRWHAVSNANRMPGSPPSSIRHHLHLFLSGPLYILSCPSVLYLAG